MKASGQSVTEYGIVMALVAVVGILGVKLLGQALNLKFTAMVPGPAQVSFHPGTTAGSNNQDGSTQSAGLENNSDGSSTNTDQVDHNTSDSTLGSNVSDSPGPVLVAGSLGSEEQLQAYSEQLIQFASKFKQEEPDLYNLLVQLGQHGKTMGQQLTKYEKEPSSNMGNAIMALSAPPGSAQTSSTYNQLSAVGQATVSSLMAYSETWKKIQTSSEYNQLSPEDQATIIQLAQSSLQVTKGVMFPKNAGQGGGSGTQTVINNSNQIKHCGSKMQCG
jgi:hypothetical protein